MRKILSFLFLITLLSCSSNKSYYEDPIETWLDKNLNDNSSYEPVEFVVIDSSNFTKLNPKIKFQFSNLITVFQRKINLTSSLISLINDSLAKKDLIESRQVIIEKINGDIISLPIIIELDDNISKDLISIDKNAIEQIAMLEVINNRIANEKDRMKNELANIGTSINGLPNELKNGQFVYHKFRAKNSLGAFVISAMIFKFDINKTNVEKAVKIK